jgi:plasmid stabilization system protein ParE
MRVILHPGAEHDIENAAAFYQRAGSPAVAARFVIEVGRGVNRLLANPGIGSPRKGGRRGLAVAGFPYTIIYREVQDGIRILVVKHDRRRPGYGGSRS